MLWIGRRTPGPSGEGVRTARAMGAAPLSAHGERFRRGWRARTPTRGRPVLLALAGLALAPGLSGCSPASNDKDAGERHDRRSVSNLVGEHIYACADGSRVDADFLADGLTLDLTILPDGRSVRLVAPATGLTFVGDKLNVSLSGGDRMTLLRPDAPPLTCTRLRSNTAPP